MSYVKKLIATSAAGVGGALLLALPASALVHTSDIANGAVTGVKIAMHTITSDRLANNSVGANQIVGGGVTSSEIRNLTIQNNDIAAGAVTGSKIDPTTNIILGGADRTSGSGGEFVTDVTHADGADFNNQPIAGDLHLVGDTSGGSSFNGAIMGNVHAAAAVTGDSYHAGVIGGYSLNTTDASTLPKAGVAGFVGSDDGAASSADAGVMAVLEGDGGVVTAQSAYGVQYLNSTPGSLFSYGLDLSHAAGPGAYAAVTYGQADIRLSTGAAIASGTGVPTSSGAAANTCNLGAGKDDWARGSLFLRTDSSTALYVCTATNTWSEVAFT